VRIGAGTLAPEELEGAIRTTEKTTQRESAIRITSFFLSGKRGGKGGKGRGEGENWGKRNDIRETDAALKKTPRSTTKIGKKIVCVAEEREKGGGNTSGN